MGGRGADGAMPKGGGRPPWGPWVGGAECGGGGGTGGLALTEGGGSSGWV